MGAVRRARDQRPDPGGELGREVRAHGDWQREPPIEELVNRREVVGTERGDVPRGDGLDGHGGRRAHLGRDPGKPFAHDERSCREIAESLIALRRHHRDDPGDVEDGQEVDDAQDRPDRAREEMDGFTEITDDADARRNFADRAAAVEHLEGDVVREDHEEQKDPGQRPDDTGRRCGIDAELEREDDHGLDQRVEETSDEPRTDAGEHELERDTLGRRDRHAVVEEHVTNLDEFVRDRTPTWTELEGLVDSGGSSPARLGPDAVLRLGACYRAVAADLAFARRRFPADPVVGRLERLTQRGRHAVYDTTRSHNTLRAFASHGYWRRVRERPVLLFIAIACIALPTLLAGYWAWRDPGPAGGLVPSQYQSVTQPRRSGQDQGVSVDDQSDLAAEIFTNNIQVTFLAFAGGILLGLGTLYVLIENGIMLGAVGGLAIGAGNGRPFFELVVAHGVLELSCIAVAGVAGLRIASAIVDPGTRSRGDALRLEARAAVEIVLGTAAWLVVAGLVEGFLTPAGKGLTTVLIVGLGLGSIYWGLVLWRGAPAAAPLTDALAP